MKKPIVAFCIADRNNVKYYEQMKNSLRKWHSEAELPLILIGEDKIPSYNDQMFFYRSTALVAKELIDEYEVVLKLDADQLILSPILDELQGDYDVAVVNNANPMEQKTYPVSVLNISPLAYANCGFVAMKSKAFIDYWNTFNHSVLFIGLQFKEQDIMNVMIFSDNYKVKRLDEGDSFYGLASKQYTQYAKLEDGKIILPKNANGEDNWPDKPKQLRVFHWGGGNNNPMKGNYRTIFSDEIVKYLDNLVKP